MQLKDLIIAFVLICSRHAIIDARKHYLTFEKCDNLHSLKVNSDKSYEITWNGNRLSNTTCRFSFRGYDSEHTLKDYQICIQATYWDIMDTLVQLKYYTGFALSLRKLFSYLSDYDNPTHKWCADFGEHVYIELNTPAPNTNQGSLTLEVTARTTHDGDSVIGWSVGGAIAGVAVITFCITVIVILACRRRRKSKGKFGSKPIKQQNGGVQPYCGTPPPPSYNADVGSKYPNKETQQQSSYQQYTGNQ